MANGRNSYDLSPETKEIFSLLTDSMVDLIPEIKTLTKQIKNLAKGISANIPDTTMQQTEVDASKSPSINVTDTVKKATSVLGDINTVLDLFDGFDKISVLAKGVGSIIDLGVNLAYWFNEQSIKSIPTPEIIEAFNLQDKLELDGTTVATSKFIKSFSTMTKSTTALLDEVNEHYSGFVLSSLLINETAGELERLRFVTNDLNAYTVAKMPDVYEQHEKLYTLTKERGGEAFAVLAAGISHLSPEVLEEVGITTEEAMRKASEAYNSWGTEVDQAFDAFRKAYAAYEKDVNNPTLHKNWQVASDEFLRSLGMIPPNVEELKNQIASIEALDISDLIVEGDYEQAQANLDQYLSNITNQYGETVGQLDNSYAQIYDALEFYRSEIGEDTYATLMEAFHLQYEIDLAEIDEAMHAMFVQVDEGIAAIPDNIYSNPDELTRAVHDYAREIGFEFESAWAMTAVEQDMLTDVYEEKAENSVADIVEATNEAFEKEDITPGLDDMLYNSMESYETPYASMLSQIFSDDFNGTMEELNPDGVKGYFGKLGDQIEPENLEALTAPVEGQLENELSAENVEQNMEGLGLGLNNAILDCIPLVEEATAEVVEAIQGTIENMMEIESDGVSQYSYCIGEGIVKGLVNGICDNINTAETAIKSLLTPLLDRLRNFCDQFRDGVNRTLENYKATMGSIQTSGNQVSFASMPGVSIPGFATGGIVNSGQIFMARENGMPEFIGRFGANTAVANNEQITFGIASAVRQAILETGSMGSGQPTIVQVGDRVVYDSVEKEKRARGVSIGHSFAGAY